MNQLATYVELRDADAVAADLSAKLGKNISPQAVRLWANKDKPPKSWEEALGLPASEPSADSHRGTLPPEAGEQPPTGDPIGADQGGRQSEVPPRAPTGAKIAEAPVALTAQAKERIAALHIFAGASIATAADAEGFENDRGVGGGVGKLWTDKADPIADAWIEWAQEGNKFALAFVRLMSTGGAGGNLALGYASLLGGTAYILGHMPDNEATRVVYGRYAKYRTVVPEPPRSRADENGREPAEDAGSSPFGAAGVMGESARPFGS